MFTKYTFSCLKTFLLLIGGTNYIGLAQKLPNKQQVSLRAPIDIKIDGKIATWNTHFQAFNKTTEIFYNITNDDTNIYLIIHATKSSIIEKIVEGAVEFTTGDASKKDNNDVSILFPLMPMSKCMGVLVSAGKKLNSGNYTLRIQPPADTAHPLNILKANTLLAENMKEIKVRNIPSVTDTIPGVDDKTPYYANLPMRDHRFKIIPVANEDQIKATSFFDEKGEYTYEMALPIKYIGQDINAVTKIRYNILIHGRGDDRRLGDIKWYGPPINGMKELLYMDLETPTDFSGEYTLAKKL